MKKVSGFTIIIAFVLFAHTVNAQTDSLLNDTVRIPRNENVMLIDTTPGYHEHLFKDDPEFNKRYPVWIPVVRVPMCDAFNWALARYLYNKDWAHISTTTWKNNLKGPWVWDVDRFGVNFVGHPHSGSYYFNVARSNGYSYWASLPFTIEGSVLWELFGEKDPPSKNDLINTSLSGMFLGEITYRLSSNILDDRARGANRVWRELLAGIINPTRALNRLTQGKMFRVTTKEVYQKEPLHVSLSAGMHKINNNNHFGTGRTNAILNIQLDYGDPFKERRWRPYDVFRLRFESRYGSEKKIVDNVLGYGLLAGKNIGNGQKPLLGLFQQYDYWNNSIFELGSLGFGPGILSRIKLGTHTQLNSSVHFAAVPLAGNNTRFGPDTSEFRDYNFGGGMEGRIEETLDLCKWLSLGFNGYYYWIYEYEGLKGRSRVGIIKPRVLLHLSKKISIGAEHHVYWHNRFVGSTTAIHRVTTEQKAFVQIEFD